MSTYCPLLWSDCYINRSGDVYSCCHQKPSLIGNIHGTRLEDILASDLVRYLRGESLSGSLLCYPTCTLLDKSSATGQSTSSPAGDRPGLRRVHISFGEACNIRCIMCLHPARHAASPVLLDEEVLIRQVDTELVDDFVLQGGEPLILEPCLNYMSHLERIGKKYTVLTNGLLIDDAMASRLALYARVVSISLNGATKETHEAVNRGSRFERVLANIGRLRTSREQVGSKMLISGRLTITPENIHEVPLFLRIFRSLGFDRVNFGFVKETVPSFLASHPDIRSRLSQETAQAWSECRTAAVDNLRLRQLGLLAPRPARNPGGWYSPRFIGETR